MKQISFHLLLLSFLSSHSARFFHSVLWFKHYMRIDPIIHVPIPALFSLLDLYTHLLPLYLFPFGCLQNISNPYPKPTLPSDISARILIFQFQFPSVLFSLNLKAFPQSGLFSSPLITAYWDPGYCHKCQKVRFASSLIH